MRRLCLAAFVSSSLVWIVAAPLRSQDAELARIVVTGLELRDDVGRVQCLLFASDAAEAFARVRARA